MTVFLTLWLCATIGLSAGGYHYQLIRAGRYLEIIPDLVGGLIIATLVVGLEAL